MVFIAIEGFHSKMDVSPILPRAFHMKVLVTVSAHLRNVITTRHSDSFARRGGIQSIILSQTICVTSGIDRVLRQLIEKLINLENSHQ